MGEGTFELTRGSGVSREKPATPFNKKRTMVFMRDVWNEPDSHPTNNTILPDA